MNRSTDYVPALRSADLPAYVPAHYNETKIKTHRALVGVRGNGFIPVHHAARGYKFAPPEADPVFMTSNKPGVATTVFGKAD